MSEQDEVLATLGASPGRRIFACGVMGVLGVMLIWLAFMATPAFLWSAGLAIAGLGAIWMGWWQWQVTEIELELTSRELRTSTGLTLVRIDDIKGIDRGALAFKPSQGFLIRMKSARPRAWAPGLYWRLGRALGIGGVTRAGQGKYLAEALQALVDQADQNTNS